MSSAIARIGFRRPASPSVLLAIVLAASLSATGARAQAPTQADPPRTWAELQAGERIRLTTVASGRVVTTRLHAVRGDSLLLPDRAAGPTGQVLVPAAQVQRLEVRRRPHTLLVQNSSAGALVGMLAGGVSYLVWCDENREACRAVHEEPPYYVPPEDRTYSPLMGVLLGGAAVGAVVGYVVTPKRWVPVDLSVTSTPAGGTGVQLGATFPVQRP